MIPDKVLYTDGHNVTVTDSVFQVKNDLYKINGITKHGLLTVKPHRLPGILILILGIALIACGILQMIPTGTVSDLQIGNKLFAANTIAVVSGSLLLLIGILVIGMMRERYAVRIATAEGEKNVIVSNRKEYISQIVAALSEAFNFTKPRKGFSHYSS
jgi:hypothetical protein